MKVVIERFRTQVDCNKQNLGMLFVIENEKIVFNCFTLELPDFNNKQNISQIPRGFYKVKRRYSEKFKNHFHVLNVPGRELILIHILNYYHQTEGCIGVGETLKDINKDGILDLTNSGNTMKELLRILPNEFDIEII